MSSHRKESVRMNFVDLLFKLIDNYKFFQIQKCCFLDELKRDNDRLKMETTCRLCNKNTVQTLFLPCRHLVTALKHWMTVLFVDGTVRVYLT